MNDEITPDGQGRTSWSGDTRESGSTRTALFWAILIVLLAVSITYYFLATLLTEEKEKIATTAKTETTRAVGERTYDLLTLAAISFAAAVRDPLLEREFHRVRDVVSVLAKQKYVTAVVVADGHGKIVAAHDAALVGADASARFPELLPATAIFVRGGIDGGFGVAAPVAVFAKQLGTVIIVYRR